MRSRASLLLATLLCLAAAGGQPPAAELPAELPPPLQQRYMDLAEELACPSCAGASVLDSPSPVARGMRREIARQLQEGRSDAEILASLKQTYGQGVSFAPEFSWRTLGLWLLPGAMLVLGLAYAFRRPQPPGS